MTCPHCGKGLRPPTKAELAASDRSMVAFDKDLEKRKRPEPLTIMERLIRSVKL